MNPLAMFLLAIAAIPGIVIIFGGFWWVLGTVIDLITKRIKGDKK